MSTDIAQLQLSVDSREAKLAESDIAGLEQASRRAEDAVDDLGNTSRKAGKKTRELAQSTGTANGKMGDFSKKAGAAGIQIQQLVGQIQGGQNALQAFSMQAADLGIVLGAPLVGVIVSLGAVVAGSLTSAFLGAKKEAQDFSSEIEILNVKMADLTNRQKDFVRFTIEDEIRNTELSVGKLSREISNLEEILDLNQLALQQEAKAFGMSSDELEKQNKLTREAQIEIAKLAFNHDEEVKKLEALELQLQRLNGLRDDVAGESEKTPWWGGDAAVEAAAFDIRMGMYRDFQEGIAAEQQAALDRIISQYSLYYSMRDEAQELELDREKSHLSRMASYYAEYTEARIKGDQIAADKAIEAEELKQANILKIQQSFDSLFRDMMDSQSKEVFEAGKIGAASKAVADAYSSINATLAQGGAFAWPAAIATGAAAFANVASIMGTEFGSQSGATAPAAPPPTMQNTTNNNSTSITITGGVGFGIDELRELFGPNGEVVIYKDSPQGRELAR